jgi:hypothetical protein
VADAFAKEGKVPSIAELKEAKVSDKALQGVIVIESVTTAPLSMP